MFASKTVSRATVACGNAGSSTHKRQTQVRPVAAVSAQNSAFFSQRRSCKSDGRLHLSHKNRALRVRMSSADAVTVASETSEEEKEKEEEPAKKVEEPKFSPVEPLYEVALESEMGVDYSKLEDLLKKGDWQAADDETREKLCVIAGEGAAERKWVYFTEVASIPVKDLQTMDKLWVSYSGGRFGYSVQKRLWKASKERWSVFFARIDWTAGEQKAYRKWPQEFIYKSDAAEGHLPLTNALRGTQLFEAIFNHPAFDDVQETKKVDSMEEMDNNVKSALPDWLA